MGSRTKENTKIRFRINQFLTLMFPEGVAIFIPQLTLSLKSIKAALANPVNARRIGSARRNQTISKT
jgi:hypothetical protein